MLIAQAQAANLTVVSNDTVFDHYGVVRLWYLLNASGRGSYGR
jgi:PIN domain nuclease of toxin-antitoxin system